MAFPIKVAEKNVENGIKKCPQHIPAKSNNGFGIYLISLQKPLSKQ